MMIRIMKRQKKKKKIDPKCGIFLYIKKWGI